MLRVVNRVIEFIVKNQSHVTFLINIEGDVTRPLGITITLQENESLDQNAILDIARYLDDRYLSWNIEPMLKNLNSPTSTGKPYLDVTIFNHDQPKADEPKF